MKTWFVEYWPEGAAGTSVWPKTNQVPIEAETEDAAIVVFAKHPEAPRGRVEKAWEIKQPTSP